MKKLSLLALAGLTTVSLAACGSDTLEPGGASSSGATSGSAAASASTSATVDPAAAAKVPAAIREAGVLKVGSDTTYAPNEFLDTDGKTAKGMDIEILTEVAKRLGLRTEVTPAGFDSIILGVNSGKFDAGISSFTINPEREKQATMVSYFNAGTQWVTRTGNPAKVDPDAACGKRIGVMKGSYQIDDLVARSAKCTDAGKPAITSVIDADQGKVTASTMSGKVDAMVADSPVALYAVQQHPQLEALGDIYDAAPYGIVLPAKDKDFGAAMVTALDAMRADGTYARILTTWGNASGAIDAFAVNPAT
ncbi:MAG: ABC transporter substrate-binding protein [Micrococcales bacterium]|nr:ABC transporter substrate-binding protein [Micrococcales bacterium]